MNVKKIYLPLFGLILLAFAGNAFAQGANGSGTYYLAADGKEGSELKTALCGIIYPHTQLKYADLWSAFYETDAREDGKVWDMYSGITDYTFGTDQTGSSGYKAEGDNYNREHSMPKSWFGGDVPPMYTDLVHLVPTDAYVNGKRANYPFGETDGEEYKSDGGFSKLGKSIVSGYTGTVFEPNDEYKGDFARIYFYMVTCYENEIAGWNSDMFDGSAYPAFTDWALSMLLEWAAQDPVSQKETDRNEAVCGLQGNRNPFIDYPGLEQYVWGTETGTSFSYDDYKGVTGITDVSADRKSGTVTVYGVSGTTVRGRVSRDKALSGLPKGVYIMNNRKYVVR